MRPEIRLSLLYFITSLLWIVFSDALVEALIQEPELLHTAQSVKGIGFITFTALLLYVLMKREFDLRQQQNAIIREREYDFHYLFMSNPQPMWVYDLETLAFLDVNNMAVEKYGYHRDEFLRMTIKDIRPPEEVPRLLQNIASPRTILQTSGVWKHQLKNGSIIDVEIISHRLEFAGRKAALVVAQDITERRRLERDLIEKEKMQVVLQKELEVRALRSRFMSMLSHEFRTPLSTILSSAGILEMHNQKLTEERRQLHLRRIQQEVQHAVSLLEDALRMMQAESVGLEFHPLPLDFKALCESVVAGIVSTTTPPRQVMFTYSVAETTIYGDEKLLRHVINNLVTNAIKYSPRGEPVQVRLVQTPDARLTLQVQDYGIGIPQADRAQLLQPFVRGSNVADIPGTGLGLALAHEVMQLHQGRLDFESEVGKGSTFTITLPQRISAERSSSASYPEG